MYKNRLVYESFQIFKRIMIYAQEINKLSNGMNAV